jgi:hypothetical protein
MLTTDGRKNSLPSSATPQLRRRRISLDAQSHGQREEETSSSARPAIYTG